MGFEQFGVRHFVSETKADEFVTFLKQGKVMTTRCKTCQQMTFPPRMDCTICGGSAVEWVEIEEPGRLNTFTTVMSGPAGFEEEVPYTLGVVELPSSVKIFGKIDRKIPIEDIQVGMRLRVAPVRLANDRFSYQLEKG